METTHPRALCTRRAWITMYKFNEADPALGPSVNTAPAVSLHARVAARPLPHVVGHVDVALVDAHGGVARDDGDIVLVNVLAMLGTTSAIVMPLERAADPFLGWSTVSLNWMIRGIGTGRSVFTTTAPWGERTLFGVAMMSQSGVAVGLARISVGIYVYMSSADLRSLGRGLLAWPVVLRTVRGEIAHTTRPPLMKAWHDRSMWIGLYRPRKKMPFHMPVPAQPTKKFAPRGGDFAAPAALAAQARLNFA